MTTKINIKNKISYADWRALQPIQRTFAIGDVGEYMWALYCNKNGAFNIRKADYRVDGYDIIRMDRMGMVITSEVKTMKFPYKRNAWEKYFFETHDKTRTKMPQYMTHDVDEYIIFDMIEGKFHVYDCKKLADALKIIIDDNYDSRWGWISEEMNKQGTAYGIWRYGDEKFSPYIGFKYSVEATTMPESFAWIAEYAKMDSDEGLQ